MSQALKSVACVVLLSAVGFAQSTASPIPAKAQGGEPRTGQGNSVQPSPEAARTETSLRVAPLVELPRPETYAVSFLPIVQGTESMAFVISPTGQLGTMPMKDIAVAYKTGYRPFTVANLLAIVNSVADAEKNNQRRLKEVSEDYDALVARYNRLAAINSAPPIQTQAATQPQPVVDERQAMRAMLFQSLLQRTFPAPPARVQVQTVDCTKLPALCANH